MKTPPRTTTSTLSRRTFLGRSLGVAAVPPVLSARLSAQTPAGAEAAPPAGPRIKLGVIGCGGRGLWIARLFQAHGGYDLWAVADYFPAVADVAGNALGVDPARRFSGLDGYRRLLDSGVQAVALETPPYFFPEHARAAVTAGKHVYMAKPVAVDVPGCLAIEAAARQATQARQVFFVDYQMPTDPHNREVVRRVHAGELGPVQMVDSHYYAGTFPDPAPQDTIAGRLERLIWVNDVALGGSYHVNACIHAVDAALWVAGRRPVAASARARRGRPNAHGDSADVFAVLFDFEDDLIWVHRGKHLDNQTGFDVTCQVQGQRGHAQIGYGGQAFLRSADDACRGEVQNLYEAGAARNIAEFHRLVTAGNTANDTVRRSVDGALVTILAREAARRRTHLTLTQLLAENQRLEVDLRGLKQ
jgi:predicted dehydrogenase